MTLTLTAGLTDQQPDGYKAFYRLDDETIMLFTIAPQRPRKWLDGHNQGWVETTHEAGTTLVIETGEPPVEPADPENPPE